MVDLSSPLTERSYFRTPVGVAEELASLVRPFTERALNPFIVDACAGDGVLGGTAAQAHGKAAKVAFLETDDLLLKAAQKNFKDRLKEDLAPTNLFSPAATSLIGKADLIVMNPPFAASRRVQLGAILKTLQAQTAYPDIGCHFILHVAQSMQAGTPLGFIFRRDAFYSRAYKQFWESLTSLGTLYELKDIRRRLRPRSGAAESVLAVFVAGEKSKKCWLNRRAIFETNRQVRLLRRGWRRLGDIANVRAGPSIKTQLKKARIEPFSLKRVIQIPQSHDGSILWAPEFTFDMNWEPASFSVPRNLACQGHQGFVYKLAGSEFRTALLPVGFHFISSTPAVLPKRSFDLNFLVGCSMLPAWREMVRNWVQSTNFTPSAVEDVFVPYSTTKLYRELSEVGRMALADLGQEPYRTPARESLISCSLERSICRANSLLHLAIAEAGAVDRMQAETARPA